MAEDNTPKYKRYDKWTNPYFQTIYNLHNQPIDRRYLSHIMNSTHRCYRCLDLQNRMNILKNELHERKDHYITNIAAGVHKRALQAQKQVILDLEYRIQEHQKAIDFHGNHG